MVIDSHCHIYPEKIAAKASTATGDFYGIQMEYDGTVDCLIENGKKAGVDKFIVESVATTPLQVCKINDYIAETVNAHSDIMYGLGTLHPDSECIEEDILHIISLGLKGVKLHPEMQKFKLDYYRCLKIYEFCEKYNLPVLIHTGDSRFDCSNPNRLKPILDIYKNLTVIGAHFGGYSMWEEACEMLHGTDNLYVDCSSSFYALSDEMIVNIIRRYGSDRVLYGTDYPMWNMSENLNRFYSLDLTETERENILYKNAVKVFNLDIRIK